MDEEVWAVIDEFPTYAVSNHGEVVNIKFGRPLKPRPNERLYLRVSLSKEGADKQFYVHQLVASHFMEGWLPGMHVRHKDNDKANNHISNLEMRNGRPTIEQVPARRGRPPKGRRVRIVETQEIFLSTRDCARYIGGDYSSIYRCIREPWRTHKGYHFEFYEEE